MAESGSRDDDETAAAAPEDLAALLALELEPVEPGPAARLRFLSELRGRRRFAPFTKSVAMTFDLSVDYAREALALFENASAFRQGGFPGSAFAPLRGPAGCNLMLARIPAGTRIPEHSHSGRELTFVLSGRLIENGARSCTSGQALDMAPGTAHEVAVGDEGECLVVFGFWPS
jgi:quercetin dioxygenase-like cupin family protein